MLLPNLPHHQREKNRILRRRQNRLNKEPLRVKIPQRLKRDPTLFVEIVDGTCDERSDVA